MIVKCTTVCLVALSLLSSFCYGQWRDIYRPSPRMLPRPRGPQSIQVSQDIQQSTQVITKPLTWQYPAPPASESIPVGPYQPKFPAVPSSVVVNCREKDAHVEVKEDLFGTGQLINPADLTLGTCAATAVDTAAQVLIFEHELQDCGSELSMTSDSFIYTFTLNYNPQPLGSVPVLRTSNAAVIVECHYPRMQNVSSLSLVPYWIPFSAVKVAEEFLYFNMTVMTSDWQYIRPSGQYSMGDMINIQVSVMQYFHVPLRVYVDTCIATTSPDTSSRPSYVFIENGCLLDARLTGSSSQFMKRTADNKLQFQLEAFKFQGATSENLYITCHLIATSAAYAIDANHRACSYNNGWVEASGGDNTVCNSCESVISSTGSSPVVTGTGTATGSSPVVTGTGTATGSSPVVTGTGTATGSSSSVTGTGTVGAGGATGYSPGVTGAGGATGYSPGVTGAGGATGYSPGVTGAGGEIGYSPGVTGAGTATSYLPFVPGAGGATSYSPGVTGAGGTTKYFPGVTGTGGATKYFPGVPGAGGATSYSPGVPGAGGAIGYSPGVPGAGGATSYSPGVAGAGGAIGYSPGVPGAGGAIGYSPGVAGAGGATKYFPGVPGAGGAIGYSPGVPGAGGAIGYSPGVTGAGGATKYFPGVPGAGGTTRYSPGASINYSIKGGRKKRHVSHSENFEWEARACLGPLQIEEKVLE